MEKKKNEDYVDKIVPNSEDGKLLILQYNPAGGGRPSYFTIPKERVEGAQQSSGHFISCEIIKESRGKNYGKEEK